MRDMRPFGDFDDRIVCRGRFGDILGKIQVPTLLIYGEGDRRAPVQIGHELHDQIPNAKLSIIPAARTGLPGRPATPSTPRYGSFCGHSPRMRSPGTCGLPAN